MSIHEMLTFFDIKITLQWVHGHSDINGNNIADILAKQGSRKDQPDKPCSIETTQQLLKHDYNIEWLNRWATGKTGRVMFEEINKPMKQDPLNQLKNQSLIFQCRTSHCKLNEHLIESIHNIHQLVETATMLLSQFPMSCSTVKF